MRITEQKPNSIVSSATFNSHTHILNVSSKSSDVQSAVLCADFIHIATETNSCIHPPGSKNPQHQKT